MQIVHERCAGLDVHKEFVVACMRRLERQVQREVRRFETTTRGLLELLTWLQQHECTHVGMEATGVYWKPVWHLLEGCMELVLANPAPMRNVPGRKSDMNDATWIAELLAHGLLPSSFVPPGCHPGASRPDADPAPARAGGRPAYAADPAGLGGCQHQTVVGPQRCAGT